MSQSKLSKSKTKITLQNIHSTDILHRGYQRKIAQSEYIKTFPKMKLRLNSRINQTNPIKIQRTQELIGEQVQNLKEQTKKLQQMNQQLLTKLRKETKFNEIYQKKMEKSAIESMSFEKLIEIKLLLEVEQLEEELLRKEEEVQTLIKTNKKKKELIVNRNQECYQDIHAILLQNGKEVDHWRQLKEIELRQSYQNINTRRAKRQKLEQKQRKMGVELANIKISIEKQNKVLPNRLEDEHQSNDTSIIGGINRTKNIEDLQAEIERIQIQTRQLEVKVQHEIDSKVKQKLLLMKQMQQYSAKIKKIKVSQKDRSLKIVNW